MSISGTLTYNQVSGVIETIVYQEARRLHRFASDKPDLEQEIRLACIKALNLYDPHRIGPSPFKFLQTCVRNHMYNLSRGKYVPNNPPCARCPLWDKETRSCMINEEGCQPILIYRQRMATKAALHRPDNIGHEMLDSKPGSNTDDSFLLDSSIRDILPKYLIVEYDKMLSGHSSDVSAKDRAQIRKMVRNLLKEE
jgi:hypothetical protein